MATTDDKKVQSKQPVDIYFPEHLSDADWTYRRVHIVVYDIKPFTEVGPDLVEKMKTAYNKSSAASESTPKNEDNTWGNIKGGVESTMNAAGAGLTELAQAEEYGGDIIANIFLPVPNELSDNYVHTFQTKDGVVSAIAGKIPGVNMVQEEVANRVAAHMGRQKVLANPGYFQNYTGTEPRTFTFTFKFIPNSREEAMKMIQIVGMFKKYSSPTLNESKTLMTAPNMFLMIFENDTLQNLLRMKPSVITGVEVNYASSGVLETTMDGMPKFLTMTLHISEARAMTQADW